MEDILTILYIKNYAIMLALFVTEIMNVWHGITKKDLSKRQPSIAGGCFWYRWRYSPISMSPIKIDVMTRKKDIVMEQQNITMDAEEFMRHIENQNFLYIGHKHHRRIYWLNIYCVYTSFSLR